MFISKVTFLQLYESSVAKGTDDNFDKILISDNFVSWLFNTFHLSTMACNRSEMARRPAKDRYEEGARIRQLRRGLSTERKTDDLRAEGTEPNIVLVPCESSSWSGK